MAKKTKRRPQVDPVETTKKVPKWGSVFKAMLREKGSNLEEVAELMGRTAAALRHWTNGTREVNLSEFLEMCEKAQINAAVVLSSSIKNWQDPIEIDLMLSPERVLKAVQTIRTAVDTLPRSKNQRHGDKRADQK